MDQTGSARSYPTSTTARCESHHIAPSCLAGWTRMVRDGMAWSQDGAWSWGPFVQARSDS
eukprot:365798-Chlamydomonas_euryale.AAC.7